MPAADGWGSLQAKRHPPELEQAKGSHKDCLHTVFSSHRNLPVPLGQVQGTDEPSLHDEVNEIINPGHRVGID